MPNPKKEINKRYYEKYLPKNRVILAKRQREKRKNNPEKVKEYEAKYREKKKEKQAIMNKVQWAIESGKLEKPKWCRSCGQEKPLQAHHKDYSKPFEVDWLCSSCHGFLHHYIADYEAYLPGKMDIEIEIIKWLHKHNIQHLECDDLAKDLAHRIGTDERKGK